MASEETLNRLRARVHALSADKRAQLKQQLLAQGVDWSRIAPDDADESPALVEPLRLSASQQHFWVLQQIYPQSPAYHIAFCWAFTGAIDSGIIAQALQVIVQRHESLRTCFPVEQGQPYPRVHAALDVRVPVHPCPRERRQAMARSLADRPFDLSDGPLFRFELLRVTEREHDLVLVLHHMIADGWSRGILLKEFIHILGCLHGGDAPQLPPLASSVSALHRRQQQWLRGPEFDRQTRYWQRKLAGLEALQLPSLRPRNRAGHDMAAAVYQVALPAELSTAIGATARYLAATPFMLVLAVFKLLLYRYTQQDDLSLGIPTAGRQEPASHDLIGLFVNTLCLRTELEGNPGFAQWLEAVKLTLAEALDNQALPFAKVVDALGVDRSSQQNPLFQILFQLQNEAYQAQNAEAFHTAIEDLHITQGLVEVQDTKFEMSWHMARREDGYLLAIEYRRALFDEAYVAAMARHFKQLLAAVCAAPDTPVRAIGMLSDAERRSLLPEHFDRDLARPASATVACQFEANCRRFAQQTALVFNGERWRYERLNRESNRLAHFLAPYLAPDPDSGASPRIGIHLERSPQMLMVMLASLKLGASYVPVDTEHPRERLAHVLASAQPAVVVGRDLDGETLERLESQAQCPVVDWRRHEAAIAAMSEDNPEPVGGQGVRDPQTTAYIMFTSGSTGAPKGVPIANASLLNLLHSMAEKPGTNAGDRWLAVTTIAFDIAALELLLPLMVGAEVHIADRAMTLSPQRLMECIDAEAITHMQATPATWRLMLEAGWHGSDRLAILCGGEALDATLARDLKQRARRLWNMYGPTETTIWSSVLRVENRHLASATVPIGEPVSNTAFYVLDRDGQLVPPGVPGELCIGGVGLSPGYWQNEALSREKFIPNPFAEHGRTIYRTGDLVRRMPDGEWHYLGRLDRQIKLNGFRIELGEIESLLNRHAAVAASVLDVQNAGAAGETLVAYCVPQATAEQGSLKSALQHSLAAHLPRYMQPRHYVFLHRLPLNANGKVDRRQLPAVDTADDAREVIEPRNETERQLRAVWQAVLKRSPISIDDNFFDLGGDSIAAMRIVSKAQAVGIQLHAADLFDRQSIAEQSAVARKLDATAGGDDRPKPHTPPPKVQNQMNQLLNKLNSGT